MILEAVVNSHDREKIRVELETGMMMHIPRRDEKIYKMLRPGEKIFVDAVKRELVTCFNHGDQEWYFQRMFGNDIPRPRDNLTYYKRRILRDTVSPIYCNLDQQV